jgi:hypothetical protein
VFAFPAEHRQGLFSDAIITDLFPTGQLRRTVIRRRFGRGETNRDGRSVTSASSCTFVNNMFGLNRLRATTVPATT